MIKVSVLIAVYNQEELVIKALRSIPKRNDIEIIVCDDGSTDNTLNNVLHYAANNKDRNINIKHNEENKGVAYTVNRLYDLAEGEYVVLLGSDDYFYTEEFEKAIKELDGTDLVYFNLQINDGTIFRLNEQTKMGYCGSTKFMRREFIKDTRCLEDKRAGEDYFFYQELLKKNPTEKFTDITLKHYNFPRKGSLSYLQRIGAIK